MEILVNQSIMIDYACYKVAYVFDGFIAVATFESGFRKVLVSDIVSAAEVEPLADADWWYTGDMQRVVDLEEYAPEA